MTESTDETVLKIVGAEELETETGKGWQLKEVLPEQLVVAFDDSVTHPRAGSTEYGYNADTILEMRNHVVSTHRYLLYKTGTTILEERAEALKLSEENQKEAVEALAKLEEQYKLLEEKKERLERRLENTNETLQTTQEESRQRAVANSALEDDLAAIRTAVGEREVKRILEEAADGN